MQKIEVNGLVYEFEDDMALMSLLDENANRVYERTATEQTPPNDPLTLEELREMGGEPYWHIGLQDDSKPPHWAILDPYYAKHIEAYGYGKRWLAYRRKPEEATP